MNTARLAIVGGVTILLSCAVVNPWVGSALLDTVRFLSREYALKQYFLWSLGIGLAWIALGIFVPKSAQQRLGGFLLLLAVISGILLADRLLLARYERKYWCYDQVMGYRPRPNAERHGSTFFKYTSEDFVARNNRYGHYDDDFPVDKAEDEFRALMLGDSIAMGYGVPPRDSVANQLERMLSRTEHPWGTIQIINAAVFGYSTAQEVEILKESLRFDPDLIFVGFCMNDITEPFIIDRSEAGGRELGSRMFKVLRNLFGHLPYETGYGRFVYQRMIGARDPDVEGPQKDSSLRWMASHERNEPRYRKNWDHTLEELAYIYQTGEKNHIPVVLLIFPHTFQLWREEYQIPQAILKKHAKQHAVDVIDYTDVFEAVIQGEGDIRTYFLDGRNHLTPKGHEVAAHRLLEYVVERNIR